MDYKFKINDFEGPLDLLLHLIKDSKMDILNIEVVQLTDEYLKFINNMDDVNLTNASEYLVMASELIELKAKALLPRQTQEEESEEYVEAKENLVNRLLEYQKYKEMTKEFKELEEKRKEEFTKLPSSLKEYKDKNIKLNEDITVNDLLIALQKVLSEQKLKGPINTKVASRELSVEERMKSIKNLIYKKKRVEFTELFDDFSKKYVVVTFLSILELAKNNELKITQENNFDKIFCEVV